MRHLKYGLGLVAAVCALVAIQVGPKLEHTDSPLESGRFAGSTWRLISLEPATSDRQLPPGTKPVTAVLSVTPGDAAASKLMAKGCDTSVRDGRDRSWGPASEVTGRKGVSTLCTKLDKKYKALLATPGVEVTWQASFVVPADAVSSLLVEVRLDGVQDFVRLAVPAAGTRPPAG